MSASIVPEVTTDPPVPSTRPIGRARAAVALVLVLLVGGLSLWVWWPGRPDDIRSGTELVDAGGLADRYGITITLVGVSADGGVVDFRYQVVDPDKAEPVIHDLDTYPKLVVEDSGATLALRALPHSHNRQLDLGERYFFLLPNAADAVHEGDLVTIVIGDVRIEHVPVAG
jgi:hypothetical protein